MHLFKILSLSMMAVLALAAVVTSATASAATLPEFVTKTGWTGTSGAGRLLQGTADEIKCSSGTNSGSMEASKKLGTFAITLSGCKSEKPIAGAKCNSTGDVSETILTAGSWHLVLILLGPKGPDIHALWLLLTPVTVKCSIFEFAIKGSLLGGITGSTLTKKYPLKIALLGTHQEYTSFQNDNGEQVAAKLESNGESATEESANNILTTAEDTLIIN